MSKRYNIDGHYKTPSGRSTFSVKVVEDTIACKTGRQYPDGKVNVVFARKGLSADEIIDATIKFLKDKGKSGIRIGANKDKPHPDTFEAFLRDFSDKGQLGSYMPPILLHLVRAEYFTKNRSKWIRYKL